MPNLSSNVAFQRASGPVIRGGKKYDNPQEVAISVRAVGQGTRDSIERAIKEASRRGAAVALAKVPRGKSRRSKSLGSLRLYQTIKDLGATYHPGGAGGGGTWVGGVSVGGPGAEHLEYVFEGTGRDHDIFARHHHPFPINKFGEGVHFRMRVSGQYAQKRWWTEDTRRAVDSTLEEGLEEIRAIIQGK